MHWRKPHWPDVVIPNTLAVLLAAAMLCVALFLMFGVKAVFGHSFYDPWCCSDRDCAPMARERVELIRGGYMIDGQHFVAEKDARPSPDADYHGCFPQDGPPKCFWAPKPGS